MKNLIKGFTLSTALVIGLALSSVAQTTPTNVTKKERPARPELNLSDTQKAQMKANREADRTARDKFEATLSADQKAIQADKSIHGKEKMEKLNASLTADQKAMMKANKEAAKKNHEAFAKTLSPEQKEQFEKMRGKMGDRMGNHRMGDHQHGGKKTQSPTPSKN
ncbi:MAG: Spy/CpxP family protein refolding chaperone [Bacteroidetes bacterium]|nr:Spy/CpxP family protein refolding chaperone [Bacteroidota bacterium]MBU1372264.1 Spy/CpxP family protein refolding chaperone [Bacteroidota bacterium]MBU1486027.1 Spy/CpxP family protein refolding chaperone [Bacteroidota bacterium]MBU1759809.1 Spy/CpxP family protein refolding chaperone [Bacteroidota bacterium]MBU2045499.1 Spy/CpxP family protein refolding chaperone [Bacteroidota bacterium]